MSEAKQERGSVDFQINEKISLGFRLIRVLVRVLLKLWFRPSIEQSTAIPEDGPVIIAPIHRSNLDFAFSMLLTDRKLYFIAKDSLFRGSILTRLFLMMGAFPVRRGSADREALVRCEEVLRAGHVLVLFPEGTRREGDAVENLLEGAAFLAVRTGSPIIPLGIGGTEAAMPKGSKFIYRVPVSVVQGAMITPPEPVEGKRQPRSAVHDLNDRVTQGLAQAFAQAQAASASR